MTSPPPRPLWTGPPYAPRDRRLRHTLDVWARRVRVRVAEEETLGPVVRRVLTIHTPDGDLAGLETTTPLSHLLSVQPRSAAAARYLLLTATTFGRPTTVYADDAGAARDYTAEWRNSLPYTVEDLRRGGLRTATGIHATPLTLEDLERIALE